MQRNKKVWPIHRKKKIKLTETIPEEAQILNILDNDSKSTVLNVLKEIKETRRKMSQQRDTISKETEIINSIQIKFVELKSTITEMKCSLEVFNRVEQTEERISELEDSLTEIIQSEEKEEKRMKKNEQTCGTPSNVATNTLWESQKKT